MEKALRYNYRLNPAPEQEAKLIEFGTTARGIWNLLLSENMRRYEYDKTFLFYKDMASLLKGINPFEELAWIKTFDSAAAQQIARDSFRVVNNFNCIRIENGTISVPKVGKAPIILHRDLASKIKTVMVQYSHGKWECSVTHEVECKTAKQVLKRLQILILTQS